MRMKLAIATGVAAVVVGTGTAAYAVVSQGWDNPTTTGNVLPIDDNHGSVTPAATTVPAGATAGDDRGRGRGTDDGAGHP